MDLTFETEQPSWVYSMYFGNARANEVPIFLDARKLGLIPIKEYAFPEEDRDKEMELEHEEYVNKIMQLFFLHEDNSERDNDYPHK